MKESTADKSDLIARVGTAVMRWQDATQKHDEAVGAVHGLGPTERLCLSHLAGGPMTASAIARDIRLTPAAVTALVDRLAARGFVKRVPDPDDRRKVWVQAVEGTAALIADAYAPLRDRGAALLATYSVAELALFEAMLQRSRELQEEVTREYLARQQATKAKS